MNDVTLIAIGLGAVTIWLNGFAVGKWRAFKQIKKIIADHVGYDNSERKTTN